MRDYIARIDMAASFSNPYSIVSLAVVLLFSENIVGRDDELNI